MRISTCMEMSSKFLRNCLNCPKITLVLSDLFKLFKIDYELESDSTTSSEIKDVGNSGKLCNFKNVTG